LNSAGKQPVELATNATVDPGVIGPAVARSAEVQTVLAACADVAPPGHASAAISTAIAPPTFLRIRLLARNSMARRAWRRPGMGANNGAVLRLLSLACIAGLAVACESGFSSNRSPGTTASPATSHGLVVVFTTWVPDGQVSGGAEPGYKPALTGLTSRDMQRASAAIDASGTVWIVNVSFTSRGAALFRQLTHNNVAACPGDPMTDLSANCAQRHLGVWLNLTQADISDWADPSYAGRVSQPFELDCLTRVAPTPACPKLVSDPTILQEITGGATQIGGALTESSAEALVNAINSAAHA
jgi:hypothetical protein